MSLFTGNFNEGTYLGLPLDAIFDFNVGLAKQVAVEHKMPSMLECIDAYELIHIDRQLGESQILFEHTVTGKLDGAQRLTESFAVDFPNAMVTCYAAAQADA